MSIAKCGDLFVYLHFTFLIFIYCFLVHCTQWHNYIYLGVFYNISSSTTVVYEGNYLSSVDMMQYVPLILFQVYRSICSFV